MLYQFPASLSRFGRSDSLLLIAAGNPDGFMPHGGWGREFASYDDGALSRTPIWGTDPPTIFNYFWCP
eukprot:SAG31_NODE_3601_length_4085_cov_1.880582_8_plen_68_part_00